MRNDYILGLTVAMLGTIVVLAVIALSGIALLILAPPGGQDHPDDDGWTYVQAAPQRRPWWRP